MCDKQPYVSVVILCMEEIGKRVSKQSKCILNQILFLHHWRGLFQVKAGVTDRPTEIKFLMQHPFIQGIVISVPPSFMPHGDTATFQMESENQQQPEKSDFWRYSAFLVCFYLLPCSSQVASAQD